MKRSAGPNSVSVLSWTPILIGLLLLIALSIVSLGIGPVTISPLEILSTLIGRSQEEGSASGRTILYEMRLPRLVGALWVGGALATAGVGFQSLFRNSLADPYIIGASSGAALGVATAIVLGVQWAFAGLSPLSLFAMLGSLATVAVVFSVGQLGRGSSSLTLLLAGVAISSMTNSLVSLMLYLSKKDAMAMTINWLLGSFADCSWNSLGTSFTIGLAGTLWIWGMSRQLDAYSLGDVAAQSLGLDVIRFRWTVILAASLATSASVAVGGVVGFIGLIAPQVARMLVGARHIVLIPMSAILGASTLVVADSFARTIIAPVELPIGIVTALLGGPFFLILLLRKV